MEKLNELKKAKVHGLLIKKGSAKNEKDLKKMEISKMQKTKEEKMVIFCQIFNSIDKEIQAADQLGEIKKTKHSSSPIDNIASHLRKEEREVIGDMVMELVDGHMTAEEVSKLQTASDQFLRFSLFHKR